MLHQLSQTNSSAAVAFIISIVDARNVHDGLSIAEADEGGIFPLLFVCLPANKSGNDQGGGTAAAVDGRGQ